MTMKTGMSLMLAGVLGFGMTAVLPMQAQSGSTQSGSTQAGSAQGSAQATPENMNQDPTTKGTYPSDKTFLKKAIEGNQGEIDAAKLALQKSQNQQVKDFAQKMVDDHTKMLDQLKQVADQEKVTYKDVPSPMAKKMEAKLQGLDGAAFDKAFVNGMVKDHKMDVREFSTEINHGKNQPIKDAATQSLPTIKEHLQIVEGLQKNGI